MTDLTDRTKQVDAGELAPTTNRQRLPTIVAMVLAAALIGLGAWVVWERTTVSETAVTEEIQYLLDDYLAAWNDRNSAAFIELVTAGYALEMVGSSGAASERAEGAQALINNLESLDWEETAVGEPIMTGKGPWYVSQVEHFTGSGYGPEGADGISTFTVVDDGGVLKVARHAYVGNN